MTVTVNGLKEEKDETTEILITGEGSRFQFPEGGEASHANIISRPVGENGNNVRGLSPDVVVLVTEVSDDILNEVLKPMRSEMIVHMY